MVSPILDYELVVYNFHCVDFLGVVRSRRPPCPPPQPGSETNYGFVECLSSKHDRVYFNLQDLADSEYRCVLTVIRVD